MFTIAILCLFTIIYCQEECPKYNYLLSSVLESTICISKDNDNTYIYTKCPTDKPYCPFDFGKDSIECILPEKPKLYAGLKCKQKEDCISNDCSANVCIGIIENAECKGVDECNMDLTCREDNAVKKCLKPLPVNSPCKLDTDCERNYGCLNSKCTRYFSLPDKTKITNYDVTIPDEGKRFCQTYFVYKQYCETVSNYYLSTSDIATDSTKPSCLYMNRYYELFELDNKRECSLNGKAYCPIGNGEESFDKYLSLLKISYLNNAKCHLNERLTVCQSDLLSEDEIVRNRTNTLLLEENIIKKHRYNANDRHLEELIYPSSYNTSIEPLQFNCPNFHCVDPEPERPCLVSKLEKDSIITVNLSNVCEETQYCTIDGSNPEMLMLGSHITGQCKNILYDFFPLKYPGENCTDDEQCYNKDNHPKLGKCDTNTKICTGMNIGETCAGHQECLAGLFCDSATNKCGKQKSTTEKCKVSYECKNDLLCYNYTCQNKLFSLKDNDKILVDQSDPVPWEKFCEFELRDGNKCISLNDLNYKSSDESFKPQKAEEECNYSTGIGNINITKRSKCGYNSHGYSYCPLAHNIDSDIWRKLFKSKARKYKNECHTLNRFSCDLSNPNALTDIAFYSHYLDKGHLYHDSVICAIDVLESNYLSIKGIIWISVITLIIIG